MKLKKIKVAGIRGFNDEQTVDFDGKLIIYSGPNGGGKTSIGEAIEWLFYGKTLKRIKGDEISKREYAGSYRNTHYHGTANPFVEAEILDTSGKLRVICRSLEIDETSTLMVDGKASRDLEEFGVSALYDRPLILQHTLQDFIFMRPKTRYEVLSAMLGLEPLVEFRNAVEAARTEFQNSLPPSAVQARNRANLLLSNFRGYPLLQPVLAATTQGKIADARKHLVEICLGRVAAGTPDTELIQALHQTKAAKERSRLNWGRFSINPIARPESHPSISSLGQFNEFLDGFGLSLNEALGSVGTSTIKPMPAKLRSFYELGLGLIEQARPQTCSFCLQDTLTPDRLAEIRQALEPIPEAEASMAKARTFIESLVAALGGHWQHVSKVVPQMPSAEERTTIEELTSDSIATRDNYFASCEAVVSAFANPGNL